MDPRMALKSDTESKLTQKSLSKRTENSLKYIRKERIQEVYYSVLKNYR